MKIRSLSPTIVYLLTTLLFFILQIPTIVKWDLIGSLLVILVTSMAGSGIATLGFVEWRSEPVKKPSKN